MVGGLIAICLVLKEFGCLFLLFSNPRIPLLKLPYIRSLWAPAYTKLVSLGCLWFPLLFFFCHKILGGLVPSRHFGSTASFRVAFRDRGF